MKTLIRSTSAYATSAILLVSLGCVSTEKLRGPQWLSFNRDKPVENETGLPDPSTLAVPTTVTQPAAPGVTTSGAGPNVDSSLVATAPGANAKTVVPVSTYPTTNQPALQNNPGMQTDPVAGFLPNAGSSAALNSPPHTNNPTPPAIAISTAPTTPAVATAPANANVQQGPYGGEPLVSAPSAYAAAPPAAPPVSATPSASPLPSNNHVATTTTWDQPAQVPYPEASPTSAAVAASGNAYNDGGESIYGSTAPISSTDPGSSAGATLTNATSPALDAVAPSSQEPGAYTPPPGQMPPADVEATAFGAPLAADSSTSNVAPASHVEPASGSHYGQMARQSENSNAAWRPGSTTDYAPTFTR